MLSHDLHLLSAASPSYDVPHDEVRGRRAVGLTPHAVLLVYLDLSSSGKSSDGAHRPLPTNYANAEYQFMYT